MNPGIESLYKLMLGRRDKISRAEIIGDTIEVDCICVNDSYERKRIYRYIYQIESSYISLADIEFVGYTLKDGTYI